jgi:hypothetical protein
VEKIEPNITADNIIKIYDELNRLQKDKELVKIKFEKTNKEFIKINNENLPKFIPYDDSSN